MNVLPFHAARIRLRITPETSRCTDSGRSRPPQSSRSTTSSPSNRWKSRSGPGASIEASRTNTGVVAVLHRDHPDVEHASPRSHVLDRPGRRLDPHDRQRAPGPGARQREATARSRPKSSPAKTASARPQRSSAHPQKSKSIAEILAWIAAHSVQPDVGHHRLEVHPREERGRRFAEVRLAQRSRGGPHRTRTPVPCRRARTSGRCSRCTRSRRSTAARRRRCSSPPGGRCDTARSAAASHRERVRSRRPRSRWSSESLGDPIVALPADAEVAAR